MRKIYTWLLCSLRLVCGASCGEKETHVVMETTKGVIELKLYNSTPLHRDNFRDLVAEGAYDSLLFHRVIRDFMIQGGDPDSKTAEPGVLLGEGDSNCLQTRIHGHTSCLVSSIATSISRVV